MNKTYKLKTDRTLRTHNVAMLLARQKTMSGQGEFMAYLKSQGYKLEQIKEIFEYVDAHQASKFTPYGKII